MAQQQSEIRPGVVVATFALLALAVGVAAFSFTRSGGERREPARADVAAREAAIGAARADAEQRAAARKTQDIEALPLPSRTVALRGEATDLRKPTRPPQAANVAAEPTWDGKGLPSREWLRWQLETLVTQANPHGSISKGALDSAVEDALALRAAKLEMEQAKDPSAQVAAQERLERASQDLASNLGIEGIDFSAF